MFLKHFSQGQFDEFTNDVLAYWFDVMDNLPQMLKELRGKEVRELYRSMNTLIQKEMILSDRDKERLSAMQLDPDEISRTFPNPSKSI